MARLTYSIIAIVVWLSLLFNLKGLDSSIDLAPFMYIFLPVCSVLVISLLRRHQVSFHWLLAIALLAYAAIEYMLAYTAGASNLSSVITEVSAIAVTILLSSLVGQRLYELRTILALVFVGPLDKEAEPFDHAQTLIYREVRRARRHHRSLALMAVSTPEVSFNWSLKPRADVPFPPRVVEDMVRELGSKYVLARVARLLRSKLDDSAIVTQADDHFVVVLPETANDKLQEILKMLRSAAEENLGLELKIGSATFPDQEVTFEALLEQAEAEMSRLPGVSNSSATSNGSDTNISQLEIAQANRKNVASVQ